MTSIKNIQPLSAEKIFDLLKKEFPAYINGNLDSELAIEFAHVYDVINILFTEVMPDSPMTITVNEQEITVTSNEKNENYDSDLLAQQLIDFIKLKAA